MMNTSTEIRIFLGKNINYGDLNLYTIIKQKIMKTLALNLISIKPVILKARIENGIWVVKGHISVTFSGLSSILVEQKLGKYGRSQNRPRPTPRVNSASHPTCLTRMGPILGF